jgi:cell wall-associated NlpC family hydrolase
MHPDRTVPARHHGRRRGPVRLLAAALAVASAAVAVTSLVPAETAQANRTAAINRQSPAVVQEASEALVRYRQHRRWRTQASWRRYEAARDEAARAAAAALRLDRRAMVRTWNATGPRHQVAVLAALTQLGTEYRRFGSRPSVGFDCSGLTSWAWRRAGVTIPRSSGDQIAAAAPRSRWTAHPGDLVHYPGHISLYLGRAGAIVHASNPQDDVELAFVNRRSRWGDPTR